MAFLCRHFIATKTGVTFLERTVTPFWFATSLLLTLMALVAWTVGRIGRNFVKQRFFFSLNFVCPNQIGLHSVTIHCVSLATEADC